MRLVSYERNDQRSIGALTSVGIIDFPTASGGELPADMLTFLQQGEAALARAKEAVAKSKSGIPLPEVRLLAPVPKPGKIIGIGLNYADHAAEGGREKPKYPMIFTKAPTWAAVKPTPLIRNAVESDSANASPNL